MIPLNEQWAIGADSMNIILYRKSSKDHHSSKPDRPELWRADSFYTDLHSALDAIVEQGIRASGLESLHALDAKIAELHQFVRTLPNITVYDLTNTEEAQ